MSKPIFWKIEEKKKKQERKTIVKLSADCLDSSEGYHLHDWNKELIFKSHTPYGGASIK